MKVEIVTFDADADRGGFGARVDSLVRMFHQFAEVRVVLTDWFDGKTVPGVTYEEFPIRDGAWSRVRRLRTYYKTDFPRRRSNQPPDLCVVESLDLLELPEYGDDVPIVLDEHNVYWNLLSYGLTSSPFFQTRLGRSPWLRDRIVPYLAERAKAFEIDALRRSAAAIVTSEPDRRIVLSELPELKDKIHVIPNCVDVERLPFYPSPPRSNTVAFVGNYNYVPNAEAARYILRELAPALPEARFVLVGSNPPSDVRAPANVAMPGFVADLQTVLEPSAVCVAPLLRGSGTRLKILTYLAAGKAVVATQKACEGLEVADGVHVLLREPGEGFVEAVRTLLRSPERRAQLGAEGRRLVETKYDWRVYVAPLRALAMRLVQESAKIRPLTPRTAEGVR